MTPEEIKSKIATLEKGLASGNIPQNLVGKIKEQIDLLKEQLKTPASKGKSASAPASSKEKEGKKKEQEKTIKIAGKVISKDEIDWCKKVVAAYGELREKAKDSKKKSDAKPGTAKAKDQVADAVANVVDAVPASTAAASPANAGESIVQKLLNFIQTALKNNKDIPAAKKKMVSEALDIIKDLLKDFK